MEYPIEVYDPFRLYLGFYNQPIYVVKGGSGRIPDYDDVELQYEDYHNNTPDFESIGKEFYSTWIQMRWLPSLEMQIKTGENEEWQTVYKFQGHNHKHDNKPIRLY